MAQPATANVGMNHQAAENAQLGVESLGIAFEATLGGAVVHDPEQTEVGTYSVTLTSAGIDDEVLGLLPRRFKAQMGHKDRADQLPDGLLNLAESRRCKLQALRIPGKPIWATQFHPELSRETNLERYESYLDNYASVLRPEERASAVERFRDSPDTGVLLPRFLEVALGWKSS